MIRNIIFDLGNVLISFRPSEFLEKKNYPENLKVKILSDIFRSEEWRMLDRGIITTNEVIDAIASKSTLPRHEIAQIFNLRTQLIFPLDQNVKVLPELKKQDFKLYFLSNFPFDIFEEIKTAYNLFRFFDGGLISAQVKITKPDSGIYKILLEKYRLIPEECLFIDDTDKNVEAAEELGMKGLRTSGSLNISEELRKTLSDLT